ncbi:DNA repair protein RadA [Caminibacter pacificus]|uniref:DNA repair protein RadA n=1 Tax=Caminibacter pacificus TaxID=1424653 RepID=A0AAJ4RCT1_9BACT|nr:DNA repair protein RadA [Caminibacter pacificus]NPA87438.1 DNA repair protein RadA [Campylobacterota bacterium]QCI29201.1 DNA repair protein RadA [Caminibacter pacificus]ROR40076.1 DNA repair protein RadA/Sms [Caminibacter pacificus]
MAKQKTVFECIECGYKSAKWMGKCPACGAWDSFVEVSESKTSKTAKTPSKILKFEEIEKDEIERFSSGDSELDLVLGGGIVPGSLVLIGGSPGVGKSTLMLKLAGNIDKKTLYVAGEESPGQIKIRAERLGIKNKDLYLMPEIVVENIIEEIKKGYELVIIDSIQTIYSQNLQSAPGSVSQVREATFELMRAAKETKTPIFIIGHITKEGSIAGPRVLEHMVDTVLYFEGDASKELRILRSFKNRFGSTSEIGIFEMTKEGLKSAKNKSFFSKKALPGSAITVILEGTRPIVLEVQALVSESYSIPKRSATGFDLARLNMILALLEKKLNLPFNQYDVFINVTGGIKINEPAADLAIIAAIVSSFRNRPISKETVFLGEVSLVGDIREVPGLDLRLKEAASLGFKKAITPTKPLENHLKTYVVTEVEKLLEWM